MADHEYWFIGKLLTVDLGCSAEFQFCPKHLSAVIICK